MDERTALRELKKGEERALVWFLDRYAPYVRGILTAVLGEDEGREELASDVFLALWNGAEKVTPGKVKAWLGAVARNKARDHLRRKKGTLPLEEDVLSVSCPGPEEEMGEREQGEYLRRAVLSMDPPDREIFLRHYFLCQTVETVARTMGMNPSTVKTRLRRGRDKLRKTLEEGGYTLED